MLAVRQWSDAVKDKPRRAAPYRDVAMLQPKPARLIAALQPAELIEQASRYKIAANKWFEEHPDSMYGQPAIDICLLLEIDVFARAGTAAKQTYYPQLAAANTRILTYAGLLQNAKKAYHDFLTKRPSITAIEKLISRIQP